MGFILVTIFSFLATLNASDQGTQNHFQEVISMFSGLAYKNWNLGLLRAARNGNLEDVKAFLAASSEHFSEGEVPIEIYEDVLTEAAEKGHIGVVKYILGSLVESGMDFASDASVDLNGAIQVASMMNQLPIIEYLVGTALRQGVPVIRLAGGLGDSIYYSAWKNYLSIARYVLTTASENKLDFHLLLHGINVGLLGAVMCSNVAMVELLITTGFSNGLTHLDLKGGISVAREMSVMRNLQEITDYLDPLLALT